MRWTIAALCGGLLLTGCTGSQPAADPAPSAAEQPSAGAGAIAPSAMPSPEVIAPQWTVDEEPEGGAHAEGGMFTPRWLP